MTEQGAKMERFIYQEPDELLVLMLEEEEVLYELEDIAVQAQIYHGVSPRMCDDETVFMVDNLVRLQTHCRLLYLDGGGKKGVSYFDYADLFVFLLNANVPMNQLCGYTLEEFQRKVTEYQEIFG